jgi:hypothetical protein
METIAISNFGAGPLAANFFSTIASSATKTKTLKSIDSDDHFDAYNRVASVGGYVSINGTLATGAQAMTVTGAVATATRALRVDTTAGAVVATLMDAALVPTGTILHVNLAVHVGLLTLDGFGAQTINGFATITRAVVGLTQLKKTSATTWVTL